MFGSRSAPETQTLGRVILVGAGPGAADLITRRGAAALASADIVYADGLVGEDIRALAGPGTRWVDVAKRVAAPQTTQTAIIEQIIESAKAGLQVVRLKGGDVAVFGRAGEEIQALRSVGIQVDVVPGVTAASAASAAAGLSLTQRDVASAVTFMTGHTQDDDLPDVTGLASSERTLVVYMGLGSAGALADKLQRNGLPLSTPVAVIERASHADERILYGTLRTLAELVRVQHVASPALLIIGEVVRTSGAWWRGLPEESTSEDAGLHLAHG